MGHRQRARCCPHRAAVVTPAPSSSCKTGETAYWITGIYKDNDDIIDKCKDDIDRSLMFVDLYVDGTTESALYAMMALQNNNKQALFQYHLIHDTYIYIQLNIII